MERNDITKKCNICGRSNVSDDQYYCSFKCSLIGRRKIYFICSIFFLLIAIILQIINHFTVQSIEGEISFVLCYLGFGFMLILAICGYLSHRRNVNHNSIDKEKNRFSNNSDDRGFEFDKRKKINIKPFEYIKKNKVDICMICKLTFVFSDFVYQCPQCNCYFHKEHIENWLKDNTSCPVCDFPLKSTENI
ncbi:MAG: hypothetical protein ACTSQK_05630 [Candidatus Heimdallarchaeota archaeon]